jgi:hypothetical protein
VVPIIHPCWSGSMSNSERVQPHAAILAWIDTNLQLTVGD